MISSLNSGMVNIPGMTDQGAAYFRNLYDTSFASATWWTATGT